MTYLKDLEKKKEYDEKIKEYCLFDDIFMTTLFSENKPATEYLLKTILGKKDLIVKKIEVQKSLVSMRGRSVRLDVFAEDSKGSVYNIEVQRNDSGAIEERARFNSGLMDGFLLNSSDNWKSLPESYVIFITENDYLGEGLPIYNVERFITQSNKRFADREHIIYVNGQYRGRDKIGKLMHDFSCKNPEDMYNEILKKSANKLKNTKGGVEKMYEAMGTFERENFMKVIEATIHGLKNDAKWSTNKIVKFLQKTYGLSKDDAKKLASEKASSDNH